MAGEVDNLVLEQLRLLRAQNDRILDEIRGLKTEMLSVRHHVRGIELMTDRHHDTISGLQAPH